MNKAEVNQRPAVDAGMALRLQVNIICPGTTKAERWDQQSPRPLPAKHKAVGLGPTAFISQRYAELSMKLHLPADHTDYAEGR